MNIVKVCMGGSCRRAFSEDVLKKAESVLKIQAEESTPNGQFKLEKCGCLSLCEQAPNVFFGKQNSPLDQFLNTGTIQSHCYPSKLEAKLLELQKNPN